MKQETTIRFRASKDIPKLLEDAAKATKTTNESEIIRQSLRIGVPEFVRRIVGTEPLSK